MALPAHRTRFADFLAWANNQPGGHEFHRGEVFARVGARRVHGLVGGNLFAALETPLKGSSCRAFVGGMKVQVADDAIVYPDVFVTCDPADLKTDMVFRQPRRVVEDLSDSTQAFDRGLKFAACRQIASLQEYVLVDPDARRVEVHRRNERRLFELHDQTGEAALHPASGEPAADAVSSG